MSDINFSVTRRVSKDYLSGSINVQGVTAAMSANGVVADTLTLSGTTSEISTASLSSAGLAVFRNLSTSTVATVSIGVMVGSTFKGFSDPRPGEPAMFRLTAGTEYRAVGTAGARLLYDITEG